MNKAAEKTGKGSSADRQVQCFYESREAERLEREKQEDEKIKPEQIRKNTDMPKTLLTGCIIPKESF